MKMAAFGVGVMHHMLLLYRRYEMGKTHFDLRVTFRLKYSFSYM